MVACYLQMITPKDSDTKNISRSSSLKRCSKHMSLSQFVKFEKLLHQSTSIQHPNIVDCICEIFIVYQASLKEHKVMNICHNDPAVVEALFR
ncbi:unnamed protein product [Gongylonema pulchrum]|uniref:Protein kinase domain-containing protein n=1 Tax=Gongylonema pulchrum TaxID=637853 RepID=A0A183DVQ3_9BILA|nr:unnamed protein product [Gongylonema pulchrum]